MENSLEMVQKAQPSLDAYQIAMHYQMGGLIAEHRKREATQKEKRNKRIAWPALIFVYCCFTGVLVLSIWAILSSLDSFIQFLSSSFINILGFIGLALFFILIYSLFFIGIPLSFYRNRNPRMLLCTDGLIHSRGGRTTAMRWDEIASTTESIWAALGNTQTESYVCTLRLHDKKYTFGSSVENARELGKTIEREITQRRIAACWQQIKQGEELKFGPLTINRQGIRKGADMVPWEQISQVHIFAGIVAIAKNSEPQKWPLVRVGRIPNFFLFVALLHLLTDNRVSYQTLEFEYKDRFLALIQLLFSFFALRRGNPPLESTLDGGHGEAPERDQPDE